MEKIVSQVLEGKKGAATSFYKKYSPSIRAFLIVKLPRREDVEEVLQDVFLSAFDSLPLFRGESSLSTWLMSIARHEVADFYRKRYVRLAVLETTKLFEGLVSEVETPEFVYRKKRIKERFNESLSSLSLKYRDILYFKYEMGMSVKEISRRMDISFKAAESMLYRARMAFISEYEDRE